MTTYDIALIGFGGVNRTLAELIATRGERLRSELGFGLRIVAITDLRLGSLVQPEGVDLSVALKLGGENETFAAHGGSADTNNESATAQRTSFARPPSLIPKTASRQFHMCAGHSNPARASAPQTRARLPSAAPN